MTKLRYIVLLTTLMILAATGASLALTVDVCVNPKTDARMDSTGNFFAASAPIYSGGTIKQSARAIDCGMVTAAPIGTFFVTGAFVSGLPSSNTTDAALVTWHFRIGSAAFDTIGPVESVAPGGTYPQTLVGSTHGLTASNGEVTITSLDPSGFVFEVKAPGADHRHMQMPMPMSMH